MLSDETKRYQRIKKASYGISIIAVMLLIFATFGILYEVIRWQVNKAIHVEVKSNCLVHQ